MGRTGEQAAAVGDRLRQPRCALQAGDCRRGGQYMSNQVSNYRCCSGRHQRTLMDGPSQVTYGAALALHITAWEQNGSPASAQDHHLSLRTRVACQLCQDLSSPLPNLAVMDQGGNAAHCRTAPPATGLGLDGPPGAARLRACELNCSIDIQAVHWVERSRLPRRPIAPVAAVRSRARSARRCAIGVPSTLDLPPLRLPRSCGCRIR